MEADRRRHDVHPRIDARTPTTLTGPAATIDGGPAAIGTFATAPGAKPWGTALSYEENFQFAPMPAPAGDGWDPALYAKRHYGWVVEVDLFDPKSPVRKHTALGRFRHENVAIRVGKDGTVVAYMGDDRADAGVDEFVADQKYVVAKKPDGKPVFTSHAEVLADASAASLLVGGTPLDSPEDIEVNPIDGSVFIALTNNTGRGNFHGQIRGARRDRRRCRIGDLRVGRLRGRRPAERLLLAGQPDPRRRRQPVDGHRHLQLAAGPGDLRLPRQQRPVLPADRRPQRRHGVPVRHGPVGCKMTGPAWTPDRSTLFLSVQHRARCRPRDRAHQPLTQLRRRRAAAGQRRDPRAVQPGLPCPVARPRPASSWRAAR